MRTFTFFTFTVLLCVFVSELSVIAPCYLDHMLSTIEKSLPSAASLQQLDKTSVVDCLSLVCDFTCHYFTAAPGSSTSDSAKSLTLELFRLDVSYELDDVCRLRAAWEQGLAAAVRGSAGPELRTYVGRMLAVVVDRADVTRVHRLSEVVARLWDVTCRSADLLSALQEALRSGSSALLRSPWLLAPVLDRSMFVRSLEGFEPAAAAAAVDGVCGTRSAALAALTAKFLLASWKTEELVQSTDSATAADDDNEDEEDEDYEDGDENDTSVLESGDLDIDKPNAKEAAAAVYDKGGDDVDDDKNVSKHAAADDDDDDDDDEGDNYKDDAGNDTSALESVCLGIDKSNAKEDAAAVYDAGDDGVDEKCIDKNVSKKAAAHADDDKADDYEDDTGNDTSAVESGCLDIEKPIDAKEDAAAAADDDDDDDDDDDKGDNYKDDAGNDTSAFESGCLDIDKSNAKEDAAAADADNNGGDKADDDKAAYAGETGDLNVGKPPDTEDDSGRPFQEMSLRLEMLIDISLAVACIRAAESYGCEQPQELQRDFRSLIGRLSNMEVELLIGWVIRRSVTDGGAWCLVLDLVLHQLELSGRGKAFKPCLPNDVHEPFGQRLSLPVASAVCVFLPRMSREAPRHVAELMVALLLSCNKDSIAAFDSKYLLDPYLSLSLSLSLSL